MILTSNIRTVIARIQKLDTDLPLAIARACAPEFWQPRLHATAEKALRLLWAHEPNVATREAYEKLMPRVLGAITANANALGTIFALVWPAPTLAPATDLDVQAAQDYNRTITSPQKGVVTRPTLRRWQNDGLTPAELAQQGNLELAREIVRRWVQEEKHLDDEDLADGQTAVEQRILRLLSLQGWIQAATPEQAQRLQEAETKLLGAINRWIAQEPKDEDEAQTMKPFPWADIRRVTGQTVGAPVDAATVRAWLATILASWRTMLVAGLPGQIRHELRKINRAPPEPALAL